MTAPTSTRADGSEVAVCACGETFHRRVNDRGKCAPCRELDPAERTPRSEFRQRQEQATERNERELNEGVQRVKEQARANGERVPDTSLSTRFDPSIIPPPPRELAELRARVAALPSMAARQRGRELDSILRIYFAAVRDHASTVRVAYDLTGAPDRAFAMKVGARLRDSERFTQTGENVFDWPNARRGLVGGKPAKEWQLTPDAGDFDEGSSDGTAPVRSEDGQLPAAAAAGGVLRGGGDAVDAAAAGRGDAAAEGDRDDAGREGDDDADEARAGDADGEHDAGAAGRPVGSGDADPGLAGAAVREEVRVAGEAPVPEAAPPVLTADDAAGKVRAMDRGTRVDSEADADPRSSSLSHSDGERTDEGDPESGSASYVSPGSELVEVVARPLPTSPVQGTGEDVHFAYLGLLFELAKSNVSEQHLFDRIERRMIEGPPS